MSSPIFQMPLRIPRVLHRELKEAAVEQGLSLNQYCLYLLARYSPSPQKLQKKKGEALLNFLEEARIFQKELRSKNKNEMFPPPEETPLSRFKKIHENH